MFWSPLEEYIFFMLQNNIEKGFCMSKRDKPWFAVLISGKVFDLFKKIWPLVSF